MAIVKTITSGSAVVHIDDSCCAGVSAEEMARRWAEVERVVWRIRENAARRAGEGEATAAAGTSSVTAGAVPPERFATPSATP